MERKFYPENFERFLKGHADQFKMSPSKKVWHGIYNDLHPGRRWPSVAMTMVFIFTLVIVGHLNTNNGHTQLYDLTSVNNSLPENPEKTSNIVKYSEANSSNQRNFNQNITNSNTPADNTPLLSAIPDIQPSANSTITIIKESNPNVSIQDIKEMIPLEKIESDIAKSGDKNDQITTPAEDPNKTGKEQFLNTRTTHNNDIALPVDETIPTVPEQPNTANISKSKRKNNVTWTYYLSPSLSYRNFSDEKINNSVTHKPRIGYEAGTAMSFNIYKGIQLTTGVQVNYSGYNIKANNTHPIVASLMLNSETAGQSYTHYTMSTYGNQTSSELTTVKNYSLQASLPIGLQYVFGENENIKFGAAAAFQPSVLIAGKAYLLSTDKRNYLTAPDLMRNLNMNTSFTTYVSIASNTFNWQIGPQVRYQLLSTYSNRYPVKEHLVNYGIRIGISKISK